MTRPYLFVLIVTTLVASCSERETPAEAAESAPTSNPEPIVVYASYADEAYLPKLFEAFTEKTGIRVTVKNADARKNVDDVIANRGSPPADLLLAPDVIGVWRAADEGALRPLGSEVITESVPELMRDPDGFWTAVSLRPVHIVFDTQQFSLSDIGNFEDLANPEFKGKLCLTSSTHAVNRSMIAKLIQSHGNKATELIVRGWVTNLALPSFTSETELLRAVGAGTCGVGIVSSAEVRGNRSSEGAARIGANQLVPVHGRVEAAGINRHAREPAAARQLLEWMVTKPVQTRHTTRFGAAPVFNGAYKDAASLSEWVGGVNLGAAAWLDEDAVKLAERAGYR